MITREAKDITEDTQTESADVVYSWGVEIPEAVSAAVIINLFGKNVHPREAKEFNAFRAQPKAALDLYPDVESYLNRVLASRTAAASAVAPVAASASTALAARAAAPRRASSALLFKESKETPDAKATLSALATVNDHLLGSTLQLIINILDTREVQPPLTQLCDLIKKMNSKNANSSAGFSRAIAGACKKGGKIYNAVPKGTLREILEAVVYPNKNPLKLSSNYKKGSASPLYIDSSKVKP